MTARLVPLIAAVLVGTAIAADRVFYGRAIDVLAAPALIALLMVAAALACLLWPPRRHPPAHGVPAVRIERRGSWGVLAVAVPVALVAPRVGLPILGFAIARYQGARPALALAVAAGASATIEFVLIHFLAVRMPLLPF
jgi:uncharacterized iron-regulated membrane protein